MSVPNIATSSLAGKSVTRQSLALRQTAEPTETAPKKGRKFASFDTKGLDALRQEIRAVLKRRSRIAVEQTSVAPATSSSLASGVLSAAAGLASINPLSAREELARLREDIGSAAEGVRAIVNDDALDDVEDAIQRIESGLSRAEADAGRNVVSTASVLEASSVLKQRSSIRIRTQEGDVVTLNLRRKESISLSDSFAANASGTASATEFSVSSKSSLALRVKGDINEEEFAAIQRVFEQADAIADEFFDGDVGKAFDQAANFGFDSDQLKAVSLKFREKETTRVEYQNITRLQSAPIADPVTPTVEAPAPVIKPVKPQPATLPPEEPVVPVLKPAPVTRPDVEPVTKPEPIVVAPPTPAVSNETDVPATESPAELFDIRGLIDEFLGNTLRGFETGSSKAFFSESFRLDILRATLEVRGVEVEDGALTVDSESGDDEQRDDD